MKVPNQVHCERKGRTSFLASAYSTLTVEDIDSPILHEAHRLIIDTLGTMVCGSRTPIGVLSRSLAASFGQGCEASVSGSPIKAPLMASIYANARTANAMDFDETFPVGVHFGVAAVVVALAIAEWRGLSENDFLAAVVAGYDLGGRIGTATGPMIEEGPDGNLDYPKVWGVAAPVVMAAAAAAARALDLDPLQTETVYCLAATFTPIPSGRKWSSAVQLPNCKYCDAGWAAQAGFFAALSALKGGEGHAEMLDGEQGYLPMCGVNSAQLKYLDAPLGRPWHLENITYKLWPGCRWTHYPLTAFHQLIQNYTIQPEAIQAIEVFTSPLAVSERFTNRFPRGFVERQYSLPHLLAVAAIGIPPERWLDDESATRGDVVKMRSLVSCQLHPQSKMLPRYIENGLLKRIPTGVRIVANGQHYEADSYLALGDPWDTRTFATDEMLLAKFYRLAGRNSLKCARNYLEGRPIEPTALATLIRQV